MWRFSLCNTLRRRGLGRRCSRKVHLRSAPSKDPEPWSLLALLALLAALLTKHASCHCHHGLHWIHSHKGHGLLSILHGSRCKAWHGRWLHGRWLHGRPRHGGNQGCLLSLALVGTSPQTFQCTIATADACHWRIVSIVTVSNHGLSGHLGVHDDVSLFADINRGFLCLRLIESLQLVEQVQALFGRAQIQAQLATHPREIFQLTWTRRAKTNMLAARSFTPKQDHTSGSLYMSML